MAEYTNGLGLSWYVVSLVDREFVLGEVDRVNFKTRAEVAASEDAVEEDLQKARIVLYIVVVACALVPLVLTIVFVFRITEPLMLLMTDMSFVATMNLEQVDPDRPLSLLSEINNMEKSFKIMLGNLLEYRQYLPQSVLIDDTTEGEDSSTIVPAGKAPSTISRVFSTTDQSRTTASAANQRTLFDASVHTKNITLLVSNISDVHKKSVNKVSKVISAYLEVMMATAKAHRGVVDDVCGDKVTMSFNALLSASNNKTRAVDTALNVLKEHTKKDFTVNIAVSAGQAICGNMGCIGMKKFFMLGPVNTNVRRLERCGRSWGIPVIADGAVTKEVELTVVIRRLVLVRLKDAKMSLLSEIVRSEEQSNEEWMYQLQAQIRSNEYSEENSLVAKLYNDEESTVVPPGEYKSEVLKHYMQWKAVPAVRNLFADEPMVVREEA